ncbi:MAG: hypothetical protein AAB492_01030 [Patescibacteria group bacterium]
MNRLVIFVLASLILSIVPPVSAAKIRVRPTTGKAVVSTTGYSKAKLSRNTNSVVVTFQNLSSVKSISYVLSYKAGNTEQGAMGNITPSASATEARDLYFGTCSHGVCTEHRNITGATLTIQTSLKNGKVHTKIYRIKV